MSETAVPPTSPSAPGGPAARRPTPQELADGLVRLLDVEEIDADLYRGHRAPGGRGRVFGGQVIAQALTAAIRSVEAGRVAHSLHAYFLRPGDETLPIIFRVERDFDGGSFTNRRVIALQRGRPILNLAASFQRPEAGLEHQSDMPDVPPPEALRSEAELAEGARERWGDKLPAWFGRPRPVEFRPVAPRPLFDAEPQPPRYASWFRLAAPIEAAPEVHQAILAYASDSALLGASMLPHGVSFVMPEMQTASLDHAMWLHAPARADDWLLYAVDSPWAGGGRGFTRGSIFTRDGRLVASVAQEGLIRRRRPAG